MLTLTISPEVQAFLTASGAQHLSIYTERQESC